MKLRMADAQRKIDDFKTKVEAEVKTVQGSCEGG